MIPFDYITEWRATAPWVQDAQVEQDLVLSRALVAIFQAPTLARSLAFWHASRVTPGEGAAVAERHPDE